MSEYETHLPFKPWLSSHSGLGEQLLTGKTYLPTWKVCTDVATADDESGKDALEDKVTDKIRALHKPLQRFDEMGECGR